MSNVRKTIITFIVWVILVYLFSFAAFAFEGAISFFSFLLALASFVGTPVLGYFWFKDTQ